MRLIKKFDVKRHFAARLGMSLVVDRPVSQPGASEFLEIKPAGTRANAPDFIGDFSLEHSSSRVIVSSIAIAADSSSTQMPTVAGIPPA